ncbi:hypothetical protein ACFXC2_41775, partial [Streptomyces lavendulae]
MIFANEPVQLVIFDCDGVLVDSERIAARVQVARGGGGPGGGPPRPRGGGPRSAAPTPPARGRGA